MFLFNSVLISSPASAAQNVKISEPTHRLSSGVFIDDQFASKLLPDGEIGSLIYKPYRGVRNWFIDPATIEEIIAMSAGYGVINGVAPAGQEIAKNWLAQLNKVTRFEKVNVLSYGNPSDYWLKELAPEQIEYINLIGKASLDLSLSRNSLISTLVNEKRQKLSKYELSVFRYAQRQIDLLSTLVNKKELDPVQLRLAQLLNSDIEKSKLNVLKAKNSAATQTKL